MAVLFHSRRQQAERSKTLWPGIFLLSRPYSWIDAALTPALGVFLGTQVGVHGVSYLALGTVALLLWWAFNLYSDRVQRDLGRPKPPVWVVAALAGSAFVLSTVLSGANGALAALVFLGLGALYPMKAYSRVWGPLGPAIRGLQTASLAHLGWLSAGGTTGESGLLLGLVLLQAGRSLVGDVRDVDRDQFELPKVVGVRAAWWLAIALLVMGTLLLPPAMPIGLLAATVVVCVLMGKRLAFEAHFLLVVGFTLYKLVLVSEIGGMVATMAIGIVATALLVSYWRVPRTANQEFFYRHPLIRWLRLG